MNVQEVVTKFFDTPGLCTEEELLLTKDFIINFKLMYDVYCKVRSVNPFKHMLTSNIDQVDWYINRLNEMKDN